MPSSIRVPGARRWEAQDAATPDYPLVGGPRLLLESPQTNGFGISELLSLP